MYLFELQEQGELEEEVKRSLLLLRQLCPQRFKAHFKKFKIGPNAAIYYCGAWRSLSGTIRKRAHDTERKRITGKQKDANRERYRTDPTYREKHLAKSRESHRIRRKFFGALERERERADMTTYETQVVSSPERLNNLSGVSLDTTSLIDDSIMHLHSLSKQIIKNVKDRASKDDRSYIEPQLVNSACNTAKQMATLMNLKLKFHQEIKKSKK